MRLAHLHRGLVPDLGRALQSARLRRRRGHRLPHAQADAFVAQILARIVIEHAFDIEQRADLLEVGGLHADRCGEHHVVRVVEMEPLPGCIQTHDAPAEHGAHERMADLRAERDEHAILDARRITGEQTVCDQRAEAVRAYHVRIERIDVRRDSALRLRAHRLVGGPLRDHPRRPAHRFGHRRTSARTAQCVADAVHGTAGRELEHRFGDDGRTDLRALEQRVVLDEAELDLRDGIPARDRSRDVGTPAVTPRGVGLLMADTMHA